MQLKDIAAVTTAEEARDIAIEYQHWASDQSLSYGELIKYTNYFDSLAKKFPELEEEFKENAII